jgi:hypothetical protein
MNFAGALRSVGVPAGGLPGTRPDRPQKPWKP